MASKLFTPTQEAIYKAQFAAKEKEVFSHIERDTTPWNIKTTTAMNVKEQLESGKTVMQLWDEIELRCLQTSQILGASLLGVYSTSYKAAMKQGYKQIFEYLKIK